MTMDFYIRIMCFSILFLQGCGSENFPGSINAISRESSDPYCPLIVKSYSAPSQELHLASSFASTNRSYLENSLPFPLQGIPQLNSYNYSKNSEFIKFSLNYNNVPLCKGDISVYRVRNKIKISGKIPDVSHLKMNKLDFPHPNQVALLLKKKYKVVYKLKKQTQCYALKNKEIFKALKLDITVNNKPYQVVLSQKKVLSLEKKFFSLANIQEMLGTIAISALKKDPKNKYKSVMKTYYLKNQSIGGSLCGPKFKIEYPESFELAISKSLDFSYPFHPHNSFFDQASLFYHANKQALWLESLDIEKWPLPNIAIVLDEGSLFFDDIIQSDYGFNNDVAYYPDEHYISIPKGDNIKLHNIHYDPEPVQHELNHGIIYKNVSDVNSNESGILHEGLADALVFLRTKDPDLGEWICLKESALCMSDKLMRTADNTYKINGSEFSLLSGIHKPSQIVSGIIWDIAKKVGFTNTAKITYKAIRFLPSAAGYKDLSTALVDADKALYNGENCTKILDILKNRAFQEHIQSISC